MDPSPSLPAAPHPSTEPVEPTAMRMPPRPPHVIVLFGATGDLAKRKLLDQRDRIALGPAAGTGEHAVQNSDFHAAVSARLRARFNGASAVAERTSGLSYLESVRGLLERMGISSLRSTRRDIARAKTILAEKQAAK